MELRFPDGSDFYAFLYGPIVLGAKTSEKEMTGAFAGPGRMEHIAPGPYFPLDKAPMLIGDAAALTSRLKPVPNNPLHFILAGNIRPEPEQPIRLQPFNTIHESRYSLYWRVATESEYETIHAKLAEEEAAKLALAARRVDSVSPGEQQSEVEHNYRGEEARSGSLLGRRYREASQWFEYTLDASHSEGPFELSLTTFGSEWTKDCSIKVNDAEIGQIQIRSSNPDQFVENVFELPSSTDTSKPLIIRIEAINDHATPMIFDLTLRRAE